MKTKKIITIPLILAVFAFFLLNTCVSSPDSNILELESKGTPMNLGTPDWLKLYLDKGVSALQALPEFKDKYVIIGEETGANKQFVISWADMASAQQRIGALIRTNIASRYSSTISAAAALGAENTAQYRQEVEVVLNAIVSVSYSGAIREADWWSLRRRYEPRNKEIFTDEYTAWVMYTIPRIEMNRQVAMAMETAVSKDSELYDITIALARDILLQGYDTGEKQNSVSIQRTASSYYDPPGTIVSLALDDVSLIDEYVLGRDVAASILSNYRLLDNNPALSDYINKILSALVINSPKPSVYNGYFAGILDSDEINAFATPGGHIFITMGLINAAKTEDALAAVIAHELAHIQLRHGMRAIKTDRDVNDWMSRFFFSGGSIITDMLNAGFSRVQEFDADIAALSLLSEAGYNVRGLVDVLTELKTIQGAGGFGSTHPSPLSRLINATVAAGRYVNIPDMGRFRQNRFQQRVR